MTTACTQNTSKEFILWPGDWRYWFRDKESKKPLSHEIRLEIRKNQTKIDIEIPQEMDKKTIEIYIERMR